MTKREDITIPAEEFDHLLHLAQAKLGAWILSGGQMDESYMVAARLVTKWMIATGKMKREDVARPEFLTQ